MPKRFLEILIEEHIVTNDDYRMNKMKKYKQKRKQILDKVFTISNIPYNVLEEWYNTFYDYSEMELIDFTHYIIILNKLCKIYIIPKINFYDYCCYYTNNMTMYEFLVLMCISNGYTFERSI